MSKTPVTIVVRKTKMRNNKGEGEGEQRPQEGETEWNRDEIREIFREFGRIKEIKVRREEADNHVAEVTYVHQDDAEEAIGTMNNIPPLWLKIEKKEMEKDEDDEVEVIKEVKKKTKQNKYSKIKIKVNTGNNKREIKAPAFGTGPNYDRFSELASRLDKFVTSDDNNSPRQPQTAPMSFPKQAAPIPSKNIPSGHLQQHFPTHRIEEEFANKSVLDTNGVSNVRVVSVLDEDKAYVNRLDAINLIRGIGQYFNETRTVRPPFDCESV